MIFAKKFTAPISSMAKEVEKFSTYDLTSDETSKLKIYEKYTDKIGDISRAIIHMKDNLVLLVKSIGNSAEQVAASATELTATSETAAAASDEVSKVVQEIALGAGTQANETEKGAYEIEIFGEIIDKDNILMINLICQ